ncbi:MAG: alpha/beta hydrolase [Lachnospiraceae bacterium]|nr:alpha/beta hydrolase [Lachnospiraceae bacterium]
MKLSLKTVDGCRRILFLLVALIMVFSFIGALISSNGGKIKVSSLTIDSRGAEIRIDQYVPAGISDADKLPCILLAHGRGTNRGALKGVAEEFARRGFVVLNVDSYGQGMSEQPVSDDAGQGANGFAWAAPGAFGQLDALEFARTLNYVDQERIAMFGHSMGAGRVSYVAKVDSGFYTFNDIMINVLAETFGQKFTEEEINQDADELAAKRLNADQMEYYNKLREEREHEFNTRVKAIIGSDPGTAEVEVGGHTVTRACQVNAVVVNGKYDDLGAGAMWNKDGTTSEAIMGGVKIANWYDIATDGSELTEIGSMDTETILNNETLADALASRSARMVCYAPVDHCGLYFNNEAIREYIVVMSQALNYNRGDLTDSATVPFDPTKQVWIFRAFLNFAAMLAMFCMIFPIVGLLLQTKFFSEVIADSTEKAPVALDKRGKISYWVFGLVTIILTFLALRHANNDLPKNWAGGFTYKLPPQIFTLVATSSIGFWFLFMCASIAIVLVIAKTIVNKKIGIEASFSDLHIKIRPAAFCKSLLITLIVLISCYMMMVITTRVFGQDFRFYETMFTEMRAECWLYALPYFLVFIVTYLIINLGINYAERTDISEGKELVLNVLFNAVGAWLVFLFSLLSRLAWTGKSFSEFTLSYSMLLYIPVSVVINRKLYKMTKSIWLGTLVNAALLAWLMVCKNGVGDGYYAQSILNVLFNL